MGVKLSTNFHSVQDSGEPEDISTFVSKSRELTHVPGPAAEARLPSGDGSSEYIDVPMVRTVRIVLEAWCCFRMLCCLCHDKVVEVPRECDPPHDCHRMLQEATPFR